MHGHVDNGSSDVVPVRDNVWRDCPPYGVVVDVLETPHVMLRVLCMWGRVRMTTWWVHSFSWHRRGWDRTKNRRNTIANPSSNENELPIKIRVLTFCLCCLSDLPKMALRLGLHRLVLSNLCMSLYAALLFHCEFHRQHRLLIILLATSLPAEWSIVCFGAPLMLSHSMPCDTKYYIIYGSFKKFIHVFFRCSLNVKHPWLASRQLALYVCSRFYLPSFALVCLWRDDQRLHLYHIFGDAGSTGNAWEPLSSIHKKPAKALQLPLNHSKYFSWIFCRVSCHGVDISAIRQRNISDFCLCMQHFRFDLWILRRSSRLSRIIERNRMSKRTEKKRIEYSCQHTRRSYNSCCYIKSTGNHAAIWYEAVSSSFFRLVLIGA